MSSPRETRASKRRKLGLPAHQKSTFSLQGRRFELGACQEKSEAAAETVLPSHGPLPTASTSGPLLLVFAHGAGAGAGSDWMVSWAERLRDTLGCCVHTFDFPHFAAGKRGPPPPMPRLVQSFRVAVEEAKAKYPHANGGILLCGKSMGSRVALYLAEDAADELEIRACVSFGYPVGAAGDGVKPGDVERRDLVKRANGPLMFVHGTRDRVSDFATLSKLIANCPKKHALHVVETGDHSLIATKSWLKGHDGLCQDDVDAGIARAVARFVASLKGPPC